MHTPDTKRPGFQKVRDNQKKWPIHMKNLFFKIVPVGISDYIESKQSTLPRLEHLIYGSSSLRIENKISAS
jgi:hypothetical protein